MSDSKDLFSEPGGGPDQGYTARDIEVLEGLEPVRKRPGMYVGGTDERALHHLFAEVLDNAMDEAVAGHADRIDIALNADGSVAVADNGRGIPIDPHPKYKKKSALEVIMTTLHAGGKFSGKAYRTAGGLHGVGVSVVNALSARLEAEIARDRKLYAQAYERGRPTGPLKEVGGAPNRRGTTIRFSPDPEIFGDRARFRPQRLFAMARSKAYLHRGVQIRWNCAAELAEASGVDAEAEFHFPGGLSDFLKELIGDKSTVTSELFAGRAGGDDGAGRVEWAVAWSGAGFGEADGFVRSYCNTIPTPDGGTHEQGLRAALTKGLRAYAEIAGVGKKASIITPEDVMAGAGAIVSVFISDPEFQGQTKDRLATSEAARLVEQSVRDPFDHWLAAAPREAEQLLSFVVERAEERLKRRREKEVKRQTASRKLRLPGKLADCARTGAEGTELFLVEGDSAGGSAKQARSRDTQAVLPLRGKILNVASAGADKILKNQEISDLVLALGAGTGERFKLDDLRYERVIIMTDADVDGAHIASLLITFFYRAMPELIRARRPYLALPPLYRLSQGDVIEYARDDAHKDALMERAFDARKKIEISRFKGLGEMMPRQLKETTMDPATRTLARVELDESLAPDAEALVETLMGRKSELRFRYIQEHADFVESLDI